MLAKVAIIEYTEYTENWRTALSGAAEVHSACKGCNNRVHRVHRELENSLFICNWCRSKEDEQRTHRTALLESLKFKEMVTEFSL